MPCTIVDSRPNAGCILRVFVILERAVLVIGKRDHPWDPVDASKSMYARLYGDAVPSLITALDSNGVEVKVRQGVRACVRVCVRLFVLMVNLCVRACVSVCECECLCVCECV